MLMRWIVTWRGSGGFGVATTTNSIFFGGVLLTLAGIGEFILGNTFPFIVFMGYVPPPAPSPPSSQDASL